MASPSHFFDPFRTPPSVIKAPNAPGDVHMLVGGLGTISAKSNAKNSIKFIVHPSDPSTQPTLTLEITGTSCVLSKRDKDSVPDQKVADCKFPKGEASAYLNVASKEDPTVYWISVDRSNARFRYGQHFTNVSMTFLQKDFGEDHKWMDNLRLTDVAQDGKDIPNDDIRYNVLPVTVDLPPLVVTDQQISLEELENYSRTTIANLPAACQTLYQNVAGPNITVESPTFPQLPEAIEQSLKDPKKVCGQMLAKKQELEPWITKEELYLRITVGDNLANSPGIPYVMEIWPPGNRSPIHDHGEASAVIKVLYGNINCTWYDDLQQGVAPKPLGPAVQLTKGDVTWLGQKQFQVHQLQNNYKTVCITLQCYQFDADDTVHDEHFDMLTSAGKKVLKPKKAALTTAPSLPRPSPLLLPPPPPCARHQFLAFSINRSLRPSDNPCKSAAAFDAVIYGSDSNAAAYRIIVRPSIPRVLAGGLLQLLRLQPFRQRQDAHTVISYEHQDKSGLGLSLAAAKQLFDELVKLNELSAAAGGGHGKHHHHPPLAIGLGVFELRHKAAFDLLNDGHRMPHSARS